MIGRTERTRLKKKWRAWWEAKSKSSADIYTSIERKVQVPRDTVDAR